MYVPQARPKDNMSREMKQRLRQEYYGLGGAENQVSSSSKLASLRTLESFMGAPASSVLEEPTS